MQVYKVTGIVFAGLLASFGAAWADAPAADAQPADAEGAAAVVPASQPEAFGQHPIGWVEFITKDSAKTQAFYSAVFGWTFDQLSDGYWAYSTPKGLSGGIRLDTDEGSPPVIPFILTADIDASISAIEATGAEIVLPKKDVGKDGHLALFSDPAGLVMGVADLMKPIDYTPAPMGGPGDAPVNNSICAFEFYGGDFAATSKFYGSVFGWSATPGTESYMPFDTGKGTSGVFQNHSPDGKYMVYIWVDDMDSAITKVKANGGVMLGDKFASAGLPTFGYFTDPSGVPMGMMSK